MVVAPDAAPRSHRCAATRRLLSRVRSGCEGSVDQLRRRNRPGFCRAPRARLSSAPAPWRRAFLLAATALGSWRLPGGFFAGAARFLAVAAVAVAAGWRAASGSRAAWSRSDSSFFCSSSVGAWPRASGAARRHSGRQGRGGALRRAAPAGRRAFRAARPKVELQPDKRQRARSNATRRSQTVTSRVRHHWPAKFTPQCTTTTVSVQDGFEEVYAANMTKPRTISPQREASTGRKRVQEKTTTRTSCRPPRRPGRPPRRRFEPRSTSSSFPGTSPAWSRKAARRSPPI